MKVCTCFLLFGIFGYTHSSASNTPKSNQRSVNLALETVLEFNNKDKEVDLKFLNNIQNFISKVKKVIDENSNGHNLRRNFKAPRVKTFTRFIEDVIHILNTYEVTAFAEFFDILDEELRNYHYRGCRFDELTENDEIRKLIAAKLDSIKGKPASIAKKYINALSDMLEDENYDRNVKEFVDYINSLYKQEAEEDFQKVITDLEAYGRSKSKSSNNNLGKIIKNGVRSIIFDHYTNLNTTVRRNVKEKIETFWKQLEKSPPSSGNMPKVKPYYIFRNNAKNSEINEVKESEPDLKKDLMNLASEKANKKIEVIKRYENNIEKNDIKQSEYKKAKMKRDDVKNEKKRPKHSRKGTVSQPLDTQKKDTRLSSQHIYPMDQQRNKNEHQEHSNTDSSSGESFSSKEFYQEPQHYTTQYTAIIPKKKSRKPPTNVSKKSEKIEALNVMTTRMPNNNTLKNIWIEESTGRLPKAVLDKLAAKPSRHSLNKYGPRHKKKYDKNQKKWHGKIYEPKYVKMYEKNHDKKHDKTRMTRHRSKDDTKYESRQKQKSKRDKKHKNVKTSEPNNPFILVHNRDFFRQNYVRTTDSVFNMEVHQYKKSMSPLRVELKQNKRRTTASTTAKKFLEVLDVLIPSKSGKTIKSPRARRTAAPTNAYSKRNKIVPWKSADHSSSSSEDMTVEKFEIKEVKRRHGQNAKRKSSSLEKDPYVIQRIKNLERQINEVKSRFGMDVVKTRQVKYNDVEKDNKEKHRQSKTRFKSDVNMIPSDFKDKTDKSKMSGTADNKTVRIIEYKNVTGENSTNKEIENDLEKNKKSETRFRSDVNTIPNDFKDKTDKSKISGTADNKTVRIIEYKNVKGENSTNKEIENDLEKNKKSKPRFRSSMNMISNDSKDGTDKTEVIQIEDNKVDVKDIDFENKEEIINNDHKTMEVTKQQVILKEDKNTETGRINSVEVTPKAKDKGIKVVMNDHDADDASNETITQNRKIDAFSTSTKATESTTKTTMTVQPTVAVTTPSTLKLSTIFVPIPVATTLMLADVSQKAEFNATVDESKNQITNNTSQAPDVSKTTLNVTKGINKYTYGTNFQSDVGFMASYY